MQVVVGENTQQRRAGIPTWAKKDYGIGGKYEKIKVVFDIKELYWDRGQTEAFSVNLKNSNDVKEIFVKPNSKDLLTKIRKGDQLKFVITLNWDRIDEEEAKKDVYYSKTAKSQIAKGLTILHEVQHVQIQTSELIESRTRKLISTPYLQHLLMKDQEKEYYKDRLNYLLQYKSYYFKWFGKEYLKQLEQMINEFDN